MPDTIRTSVAESPAKQLARFIARFDPEVAKVARQARRALRRQFPTATEIVYDNYQALAIGFATTERTSSCMSSLAVMAKGVSLSFYYGARLPDPDGILLGSGNQNRFVRLHSAAVLDDPAVQRVLSAAVRQADPPLPGRGKGPTHIRSISAKQRPRRPAPRATGPRARRTVD